MYTVDEINKMGYVDFMASLDELNRPPGGKNSLRVMVQNTFLNKDSYVLHVACNTGSSTVEVAHLAGCRAIGVDINQNMIKTANKLLNKYHKGIKKSVSFQVANGMRLPFKSDTFDLVFSAGGTAFIDNKQQALHEYTRVCKDWGFIGEINFFYHANPPKNLISDMNNLMKINIQPWDEKYWLNIYNKSKLELYYHTYAKAEVVSNKKVEDYCSYLVTEKHWSKQVKLAAIKRLKNIMTLFNENNKYLAYGIFIMRKRSFPEVVLF